MALLSLSLSLSSTFRPFFCNPIVTHHEVVHGSVVQAELLPDLLACFPAEEKKALKVWAGRSAAMAAKVARVVGSRAIAWRRRRR